MDLSAKVAVVVVVAASLFGVHQLDKNHAVKEAVIATQTAKDKEYQNKLTVAQNKAIEDTKKLAEASAKAIGEKDAKISSITLARDNAVRELYQSRNQRPTSTTQNRIVVTDSPGTCDARELYAEDAEFLVREASRADSVIVERDYYYNRYEAARKLIDEERK